ncbi:hypothetical protein SNE40_011992 [Patella caerulea]|uniref:N-acetyltransferase domain-containing protein n=1 Tax=Patella caerulea TaxID=87958 RepID=A0AAN8JKV7_PATCE
MKHKLTCKVDDLIIRTWCQKDDSETKQVLRDGSYSNIIPWCKIRLKKLSTFTFINVLTASVYFYFQNVYAIPITVILNILVVYLLTSLGTLYYLYGPPLYDMNNVKEVYLNSEDTHFWVAEVNGHVAGTIAIVRSESDDNETQKVAWLRRLVVHRNYRGMGIARKLVSTTQTFCKNCNYTHIKLLTTEVHEPARNLYESMGFKLRNYYCKYLNGLVPVWSYDYIYNISEDNE